MLKFILVGMPRTGSTLLQTTLGQHPEVLALGELFHWVQAEREGRHAIQTPDGPRFFDPERDEPIAFLQDAVWGPQNSGFRAAGFKLFAEFVEADSTRALFARIRAAWPDLSVIHIRRDNLLDVLVSRRMATETGEWMRAPGEAPPQALTFAIPVGEAEAFFETYGAQARALEAWAGRMRAISIEYQELQSEFPRVAREAFAFLGVEPVEVQPALVKQMNRPPREVLENWSELADHFRGTEHAAYFS